MSSVAPFIIPVVTAIASVFIPPLAALLPEEMVAAVGGAGVASGILGAGLGAGSSLLGSAITGQPVSPLGVALGAAGGGLGASGVLGSIGEGISNFASGVLGSGSGAAAGAGAGAAAGSIAETAGAAATEAAASAAPVAAAAGPGVTAGALSGAVDPVYGSVVSGGGPALGATSNIPTGAYFSGAGGPTAGGFGNQVLSAGKNALTSIGLSQALSSLMGSSAPQQQASPMMARGSSLGGQYTTGQGGQYTPYTYEGGLGTAPTSGYLDPAGKFISSKQRQGSLGDLATTVLG